MKHDATISKATQRLHKLSTGICLITQMKLVLINAKIFSCDENKVFLINLMLPQTSDNNPWAYICSKGFFDGLSFFCGGGGGGAYFWKGLTYVLLQEILHFKR